ncbi:MAG: tryptophan--tRNA ligase, partial [Pyrinomonadaceae bacterium]
FANKGYAQLKHELAEVTVEFLRPFQERVQAITDQELSRILAQGRDKAQAIASATLKTVMTRMGLVGANA